MGSLFSSPQTQSTILKYRGIYKCTTADSFTILPSEEKLVKKYRIKSATLSEFMIFISDLNNKVELRTVVLRVISNFLIKVPFIEESTVVIRTKEWIGWFEILENEGSCRTLVIDIQ